MALERVTIVANAADFKVVIMRRKAVFLADRGNQLL